MPKMKKKAPKVMSKKAAAFMKEGKLDKDEAKEMKKPKGKEKSKKISTTTGFMFRKK